MKKLLIVLILCILSFSGCVVIKGDDYFTLDLINEARKRILKEHPEVEIVFYEFTGGVRAEPSITMKKGVEKIDQGAKKISDLIWWEFIFGCEGNKTAVIKKINGEWQQSIIVNSPWAEDVPFKPEYIRIDLYDAIQILKVYLWEDATPCDTFDFVVFRQPLKIETTEPYYIFTIAPHDYVYVGAITGGIKTEKGN